MNGESSQSDKNGTVYLCRANGEGSHNFKVCASLEEVLKFYGEMFGEDTTGDLMDCLRNEDRWSNGGTAYHEDLYCATFDCWKVDPRELALVAPSAERGHDYHDALIEECAKVCDDYQREGEPGHKAYEHETAAELAARIRAIQFNAIPTTERRCTCYVLPHTDDCGLFVGITQSGERVFAEEATPSSEGPTVLDKTGAEYRKQISDLCVRIHELEQQLAGSSHERELERHNFINAFVKGAKWWEYHKTGATMWPSDQALADAEGGRKFDQGPDPIEKLDAASAKLTSEGDKHGS
jgi:hypothetical protein